MENINDFISFEKPSTEVIEKYTGKVPNQIIDLWKCYGFGSMLNGYLRAINPEKYLDILKESYIRYEEAIPIFTTGMGDILVWENNYLLLLKYRKGTVDVVAGKFKFFFINTKDDYFLEKVLDWKHYQQALNKYGKLEIDECFGYTPLLALGGPEKVENLQKVKLIEHVYLITQFMGPIE
ncbi:MULTISPECIES: T6SS immunity protein Tdi1 domain-containing protein [Bacillus]|uniref:T6SS immunity protein Tdi1 domain-containing protein n=1 Tax=Bacillus TaxID=1386 RepID=UPI0009D8CB32|nr:MULTISPECIES: T6SS immunity protein Tdi1 domain-containing protein [Bacillus]PEB97586.1 hypothetical protein CON04_18265 [Bacillus cereus]PEC26610.1 hypothetical protein CON75_18145 [Bacillus thuringiensis]PEQ77049.1 hypothetical protein CN478_15730 [Bacillus cereus]PFZ17042.1 hypothetical protein COL73_25490 [Bacillus thuringiensis]SMD37378.1 hypothetical protein SAMN06272738_2554 [Bacillus sp. JKS001846]